MHCNCNRVTIVLCSLFVLLYFCRAQANNVDFHCTPGQHTYLIKIHMEVWLQDGKFVRRLVKSPMLFSQETHMVFYPSELLFDLDAWMLGFHHLHSLNLAFINLQLWQFLGTTNHLVLSAAPAAESESPPCGSFRSVLHHRTWLYFAVLYVWPQLATWFLNIKNSDLRPT